MSVNIDTWDRYCQDQKWQRRDKKPIDLQAYITDEQSQYSFK